MPAFIREGFNRDDDTRQFERLPPGKPFPRGTTFLYDGAMPRVGMYVTLQLSFKRPMHDGWVPGEKTTWCLMGGRVHTVVNDAAVIAAVTPTSCNTPDEIEGEWDAVLAYEPEYDFPWVLKALLRRPEDTARGPRPTGRRRPPRKMLPSTAASPDRAARRR